ncbi:MAG TPA: sigma-70 family RNA polymerase sigma factor [Tepidisphaeraceae bacterium]|nr:sigma-70 family RNA polymerase sigma factor [Tepidisphaeraceae bacterium]
MAQISQADKYLIDQIRRGSSDGWVQLVARYQGRLLAFARGQLSRKAEAEDLVQETFLMFLQSLRGFRDDYSLETYLFTILRRKIIDLYRGRQLRMCFVEDALGAGRVDPSAEHDPVQLRSPEPTASWYVRRDEQAERARAALAAALGGLIDRLKQNQNFRDLKIIEMLFYAQMRNQAVGRVLGMDEKQIALIKHRMIKELRQRLGQGRQPGDASLPEPTDSMLTEVWEENRFTCPKRSTIGRFLLGTLEDPWNDYVNFHVNRLNCRFCRANIDDLQSKTADRELIQHRQRIFESTIGFFRPE